MTQTRRTLIMENTVGLVETLRVVGPRSSRPQAESYSPDFQVCLPYHGAFVWHVGHDDVVADPNQVLFVAGGEGFRLSQPVPDGYAELIATVQPTVLAEILGVSEQLLSGTPLFRQRSRPAARRLQQLGAECLHQQSPERWDGLAGEEWLIRFLRTALASSTSRDVASPSTARLLKRAKEYLSANLSAPIRLTHVARAAGTSPAYLTTVFSRLEGVSLHRYLVQLRLARALVDVPHTADLTGLACELGFANHSHFTASFRQAFGCTPSRFRASIRRHQLDARQRAIDRSGAHWRSRGTVAGPGIA